MFLPQLGDFRPALVRHALDGFCLPVAPQHLLDQVVPVLCPVVLPLGLPLALAAVGPFHDLGQSLRHIRIHRVRLKTVREPCRRLLPQLVQAGVGVGVDDHAALDGFLEVVEAAVAVLNVSRLPLVQAHPPLGKKVQNFLGVAVLFRLVVVHQPVRQHPGFLFQGVKVHFRCGHFPVEIIEHPVEFLAAPLGVHAVHQNFALLVHRISV